MLKNEKFSKKDKERERGKFRNALKGMKEKLPMEWRKSPWLTGPYQAQSLLT
jgi:hypothetical protein